MIGETETRDTKLLGINRGSGRQVDGGRGVDRTGETEAEVWTHKKDNQMGTTGAIATFR